MKISENGKITKNTVATIKIDNMTYVNISIFFPVSNELSIMLPPDRSIDGLINFNDLTNITFICKEK
ncbi:hypothetical protein AA18890_2478 [Komagataeibacter europaeus LMG 18890]|nr:hypothetical protein AA18890_2478 [Komagataeibacter europaeus LMG 18890]